MYKLTCYTWANIFFWEDCKGIFIHYYLSVIDVKEMKSWFCETIKIPLVHIISMGSFGSLNRTCPDTHLANHCVSVHNRKMHVKLIWYHKRYVITVFNFTSKHFFYISYAVRMTAKSRSPWEKPTLAPYLLSTFKMNKHTV